MKKCLNGYSSVMLLPLMLLLLAPRAEAVIQLTLSSGGTTVTVNDEGPGDSAVGIPGVITFIGTVNTWTINVTTGSVAGNPNPLIDLNSVNTGSGSGANALTMKFSGTNYPGPATGFTASIGGTLAAGHSLTYSAYVNSNNMLNQTNTQIGTTLNFGPGGAFSGSRVGGSTASALYSLTQVVVLSATQNGTSSYDANITAVPEPISAALLGGIFMLTGLAIRRKAKSAKA